MQEWQPREGPDVEPAPAPPEHELACHAHVELGGDPEERYRETFRMMFLQELATLAGCVVLPDEEAWTADIYGLHEPCIKVATVFEGLRDTMGKGFERWWRDHRFIEYRAPGYKSDSPVAPILPAGPLMSNGVAIGGKAAAGRIWWAGVSEEVRSYVTEHTSLEIPSAYDFPPDAVVPKIKHVGLALRRADPVLLEQLLDLTQHHPVLRPKR